VTVVDQPGVTVAVADGVATLTLVQPAKRNAVTYEMWLAIGDNCAALADDPSVRVLLLRGRGAHFCAGADISSFSAVEPSDYQTANLAAEEALASFPKPTIAVITGSCIGGGVQLAAACDLRLADETARFGITPARLGLVYPAAAVGRVIDLIGPSMTKHLLYSAEIVSADRALRVGLIDELHRDDTLGERLVDLLDLLAHKRSLLTQMAAKEMVNSYVVRGHIPTEVRHRWAATLAASTELAEGVAAFGERRDPSFTWTPPRSGPASRP
jgi:enoyl-CoA hydratase/carnithine racemase